MDNPPQNRDKPKVAYFYSAPWQDFTPPLTIVSILPWSLTVSSVLERPTILLSPMSMQMNLIRAYSIPGEYWRNTRFGLLLENLDKEAKETNSTVPLVVEQKFSDFLDSMTYARFVKSIGNNGKRYFFRPTQFLDITVWGHRKNYTRSSIDRVTLWMGRYTIPLYVWLSLSAIWFFLMYPLRTTEQKTTMIVTIALVSACLIQLFFHPSHGRYHFSLLPILMTVCALATKTVSADLQASSELARTEDGLDNLAKLIRWGFVGLVLFFVINFFIL